MIWQLNLFVFRLLNNPTPTFNLLFSRWRVNSGLLDLVSKTMLEARGWCRGCVQVGDRRVWWGSLHFLCYLFIFFFGSLIISRRIASLMCEGTFRELGKRRARRIIRLTESLEELSSDSASCDLCLTNALFEAHLRHSCLVKHCHTLAWNGSQQRGDCKRYTFVFVLRRWELRLTLIVWNGSICFRHKGQKGQGKMENLFFMTVAAANEKRQPQKHICYYICEVVTLLPSKIDINEWIPLRWSQWFQKVLTVGLKIHNVVAIMNRSLENQQT